MPINIRFDFRFFPVGQGLFSGGTIRDYQGAPQFVWVYDCGTISSQEFVDLGIRDLREILAVHERLDLVTLSHFDHDHISGVCRLIENFKIGTLMLPYMPLNQRLVIAFEEGLTFRDELIGFFLNPVAYLTALGGLGIERILFVEPSGEDGPPSDRPGPEPDRPPFFGEGPLKPIFRAERPNDEERRILGEGAVEKNDKTKTWVEFLIPGEAIRISAGWEFIPYNDDPKMVIPPGFVGQVNAERARLLSTPTNSEAKRQRSKALHRLKETYDLYFGKSSEQRNAISLYLYGGPIYASWRDFYLYQACTHLRRGLPIPNRRVWPMRPPRASMSQCSILYTGDGYLDESIKLDRLIKYLGTDRCARLALFQVMHHGAEGNWHRGIASSFAPVYSVFSSDPERRDWRHPHAAVLRDFWPYGPLQVDKDRGVRVGGLLRA